MRCHIVSILDDFSGEFSVKQHVLLRVEINVFGVKQ
jgi:hypothetical protein